MNAIALKVLTAVMAQGPQMVQDIQKIIQEAESQDDAVTKIKAELANFAKLLEMVDGLL